MKDNPRLWLVFIILLPWVINSLRFPGSDYDLFTSTAHDLITGQTFLYDAAHARFSYLPWSLFISLPFVYIAQPFGVLIFNTLSLGLLIWSTWALVKPVRWWILALSLTTIYTGLHIMLGQWDIIVLAGLTIGWLGIKQKNPWLLGIGLLMMTTKYTNVILPMLLMLFAVRHWSIKKIIQASSLPILILGISFIILGWDWPVRYLRLMRVTLAYNDHYQLITLFTKTQFLTSYWRYAPPYSSIMLLCLAILSIYLIYRMIRMGVYIDAIFMALSLNMVLTPYLMPYHNIYLAPVQAYLLKHERILGFILFAAAIVDLCFILFGIGLLVFPIVTLLVLVASSIKNLFIPSTQNQIQGLATSGEKGDSRLWK